jgi:hypothetical protein
VSTLSSATPTTPLSELANSHKQAFLSRISRQRVIHKMVQITDLLSLPVSSRLLFVCIISISICLPVLVLLVALGEGKQPMSVKLFLGFVVLSNVFIFSSSVIQSYSGTCSRVVVLDSRTPNSKTPELHNLLNFVLLVPLENTPPQSSVLLVRLVIRDTGAMRLQHQALVPALPTRCITRSFVQKEQRFPLLERDYFVY